MSASIWNPNNSLPQSSFGAIDITAYPYLARGDGVTDDYASIVAAEAAAFAAGKSLLFPNGGDFITSQTITFRVPIIGTGATLTCTAATPSLTDAILYYTGVTRPSVVGLTVNCNSKRRGVLFVSCTDVYLESVTVNNALFGGIAFYSCTNAQFAFCKVDGVIYPTPSTGHAADGFYIQSSTGIVGVYSIAKNFRRIGFVSEGEVVGVKSDNIIFIGCVAQDANNCDDSATEFNAAFWNENTNNVTYVACAGRNISSGVGQTSGRVRGFVGALGSDSKCVFNYVACGIYDNTTRIPTAFACYGTSQLPTVNYQDCYAIGCAVGIESIGGLDVLSINQITVDDINSINGAGAITFNIATNAINEIHIDGLKVTNKTYTADAADIDFFTANAATIYTLKNAYGISHIMRQAVAKIIVQNATIEFGAANYTSFSAAHLIFGQGTVLNPRSGAVDKRLFQDFQMVGGLVEFNGAELKSSSAFDMTYTAGGVNILGTGAIFDNVCFIINMTDSFVHQFTGCRMINVQATNGFYKSNNAAPTKQVLICTGNYFAATNVANTPLIKGTNNPTNTILQSNTYNTTNLHTFTGGVTQANNTLV